MRVVVTPTKNTPSKRTSRASSARANAASRAASRVASRAASRAVARGGSVDGVVTRPTYAAARAATRRIRPPNVDGPTRCASGCGQRARVAVFGPDVRGAHETYTYYLTV